MPNTTVNLIGQRFGRLLVTKRGRKNGKRQYWVCVCECGTEKEIRHDSLTSGAVVSCTCYTRERHLARITKHGLRNTPEYNAWWAMRDRCSNPDNEGFADYGGRGIQVCERWATSFEAFYEDMGPRPSKNHSIDRIDNDGHYEPHNCKWATATEQANNKRNNHRLEFEGRSLTISEWAREKGMNRDALWTRIRLGWDVESALTTPVKQYKPRKK